MSKKVIGLLIVFICFPLLLQAGAKDTDREISRLNKMSVRILNAIVKKNMPRKFNFDDVDFSFLKGLSIDVINLRMSENPDFMSHPLKIYDHFYQSQNLHVSIKFLPLLIAKVHMREMKIDQPRIYVIRNEEGNFSLQDMMKEQKGPVMDWLNVDNMKITRGYFHYIDASPPRKPLKVTFDEMDATVTGFSLNHDFKVDVSLKGPGSLEKNIFFNGMAGPIKNSKNFHEVPVDMDFKIKNAPLIPYLAFIPEGMPIPVSGEMSVNYHVSGDLWSGLKMKGDISMNNVILSTEDGKIKSIPFHTDLSSGHQMTISAKDKTASIEKGYFHLNKTALYINGTVKNYSENPELDMKVSSPAIDFDDIKKIHPFQEAYLPEGMTYSGFCAADMHVKGDMCQTDIEGKLDLTDTVFEIPGLCSKKEPSRQILTFKAKAFPETKTFIAEGTIKFETLSLSAPDIINRMNKEFRRHLKSKVENVSITHLNGDTPITIETLDGKITYGEEIVTLIDIQLTNCYQDNIEGIDAIVNGTIHITDEVLDITGEMILPKNDSAILSKKGAFFKKMVIDSDDRMHIPIKLTGSLTEPKIAIRQS